MKIGRTNSAEVSALKKRMSSLYSTGVPVPFELHYAVLVDKPDEKEDLLHKAFDDFRENPNPKKEFFRVDPERVVAAMQLTGGEKVSVDDTPDNEISQTDIDARNRTQNRQVQRMAFFQFSSAGVPVGAELNFIRDHSITAEVLDEHKIKFEGKEYSLSGAARVLLEREGLHGSVAGPLYWEYNGETLQKIKGRMEADSASGFDE